MAQQHGLGRGLASLIPQKKAVPEQEQSKVGLAKVQEEAIHLTEETSNAGVLRVSVTSIVPNPHQPRIHFDEGKLEELSQSIREHGVLQPLIVTKIGEDQYELVAGERRFQASKLAGLKDVPVLVREANEQEKFELAIIENVQRHDLNPIEEAKAYHRLWQEFGMSQEVIARKMGKSRSAVANITRLLQLPIEIQKALIEMRISEGHAKAILALDNPEKQRALFELIVKNGLTVREAESKARQVSVSPHARTLQANDSGLKEKEDRLMEIFGTKVKINKSGKGGKIVIEYYGEEDLTHLMNRLAKKEA